MEGAWLAWLQTFGINCKSLSVLTDGAAIAELLHSLDPDGFASRPKQTCVENWVLRSNNCKRLQALMLDYIRAREPHISEQIQIADTILIARNGDLTELQRLLHQVLLVSLVCPNGAEYRNRLHDLGLEHFKPLGENLLGNCALEAPSIDMERIAVDLADASTKIGPPYRHISPLRSTIRLSSNESQSSSHSQRTKKHGSLNEYHIDDAFVSASSVRGDENSNVVVSGLTQLQKQYRELQNQLLQTEAQLEEKLVECSDQAQVITQLEHRWTAARRENESHSATMKEIEQKQHADALETLGTLNQNLKLKLIQKDNDLVILQQRISDLEVANASMNAAILAQASAVIFEDKLCETHAQVEGSEEPSSKIRPYADLDLSTSQEIKFAPSGPCARTLSGDQHYDEQEEPSLCSASTRLGSSDETKTTKSNLTFHEDKILDLHHQLDSTNGHEERLRKDQTELRKQFQLQALQRRLETEQLHDFDEPIHDRVSVDEAHVNKMHNIPKVPRQISSTRLDEVKAVLDPCSPQEMRGVDWLLKRQEETINSYRRKFETLQQMSASAAERAEKVLKEQRFKVYRKTAEQREARLRRDNILLSHAFHDLAAKLQQTNTALRHYRKNGPRP